MAGKIAWPSLLLKWIVPLYPVAVFPKASRAVTVKFPATPAWFGEGKPATRTLLAAAGWTVIACVPAIELVAVSVAISDWLPADFSVALKVCMPPSPAVKV